MDDEYEDPRPLIVVAARTWNVALMRPELAAGADPHLRRPESIHSQEGENSTLISLCLRSPRKNNSYLEANHVECVRLLLEAGADPCAVDEGGHTSGWTTVYFAALYNHHESLTLLLEAGAGALVDTKMDVNGWTALAQAAQSGHMECVELLLAAGADVELRVQNEAIDVSPFELALGENNTGPWPRMFPVLLRAGATIPPDTQDPYLVRVRSAGGWGRYERACRARLAKILARVVFPRLPTDTVSHVVHFAFHTGYY